MYVTFPVPDEVFNDLFLLIAEERVFTYNLWQHIAASMERWVIGFAVSSLWCTGRW